MIQQQPGFADGETATEVLNRMINQIKLPGSYAIIINSIGYFTVCKETNETKRVVAQ